MNVTEKKTDVLTWAASTDKQIQLSNSGFITRLDLELYITLSATAASDLATHGIWRAIQGLRIQGGSGKVYFNMSGVQMGVLLHALNLHDFPGKTWREIQAQTQSAAFRIHFGTRPRDVYGRDNPFDLTAAIPAMDETTINIIWSTTPNSALDDTITISSGTMYVTEHRVLPANRAVEQAIKSGLKIPISSSEAYDPSATKSNLSGIRYIPTGNWVKRIAIAAQDDTAVGSFGPLFVGDQVTEVGLKSQPDNLQIINALRTKQLELNNSLVDGMAVVNTPNIMSPWSSPGLYILDLREYGQSREYGFNTRGYGANDLQLQLTIGAYASGETEQIWYEQYEDYRG